MHNQPVLIAAASGRALAVSARRAGYAPLVVDYFGDQDMLATAQAHVWLARGLESGMESPAVIAALQKLSKQHDACSVLWGSGFEDQPSLLRQIAQSWKLIGNGPDVVEHVKHPMLLPKLCRSCDIPYPDTRLDRPDDGSGWLIKRIGGAGGTHIRDAMDVLEAFTSPRMRGEVQPGETAFYYQRRIVGEPISALVLSDGKAALLLGLSTQWSNTSPSSPFRYGGAVRPAPVAPELAERLKAVAQRLTSLTGLVGLNSFDFLVDGSTFHLLEINPRPGATIDIFEPPGSQSLFALHVDACRGRLPDRAPVLKGAAASAVVYAPTDIPQLPSFDWPDWSADRPIAGSFISAHSPLCSVLARAATAAQARHLVEERAQAILPQSRTRPS
jgi:predicted ATP-grasp superfamily ATP-dependent carboligase